MISAWHCMAIITAVALAYMSGIHAQQLATQGKPKGQAYALLIFAVLFAIASLGGRP